MAFHAKQGQATMSAQSSTPRSPAVAPGLPRTNGTRPMLPSGTAPLKRKAEASGGPPPKFAKTDGNEVPPRLGAQTGPGTVAGRPIAAATGAAGAYKGTSRGQPSSALARPTQGTIAKPTSSTPPTVATAAAAKPAPKGYAAVLAKAAAAAEAHKAAAMATIVHKPVEKLTKRERERLKQDALEKQKAEKAAGRNGKMTAQAGRSRSGTPGDTNAKVPGKKPAPKIAYQGTMRRLPTAAAAPVGYKGTMRAVDPAKPAKVQKTTDKFGGQDKYGGYASWSDLDEAEDEDPRDYDSASDMEGGFDEMEEEELATTRLARKEDQEALAEEERLKKEKLARKQKLMALSKDARGKKKF